MRCAASSCNEPAGYWAVLGALDLMPAACRQHALFWLGRGAEQIVRLPDWEQPEPDHLEIAGARCTHPAADPRQPPAPHPADYVIAGKSTRDFVCARHLQATACGEAVAVLPLELDAWCVTIADHWAQDRSTDERASEAPLDTLYDQVAAAQEEDLLESLALQRELAEREAVTYSWVDPPSSDADPEPDSDEDHDGEPHVTLAQAIAIVLRYLGGTVADEPEAQD